jgi:hypothetical protein
MKTRNSFNPSESAKANQRRALLEHMKQCGKVSTIESREQLGISHPAGRICELRAQGLKIDTHRVLEADASGRFHGVALYILRGAA